MCKARSVRCCCHPDGCGNCCGITCKRCAMCDVDYPRWNCTRCELYDPRVLCCKQPCMCLLVWGCLCFRCPCNEYCCHACCPKNSGCGKNGHCACRVFSTKLSPPGRNQCAANIVCNLLIPLCAVGWAGVCAVFLDEQLEGRVPRFIYLMLEVLTFPAVLFITETLLQTAFRRCLALCPRDKRNTKRTKTSKKKRKKLRKVSETTVESGEAGSDVSDVSSDES